MTTTPVIEPGQSWAIRDDRYEGWRYVTVELVTDEAAKVRPRSRSGRRSTIRLRAFQAAKFTLCGYDGSGRLPAYSGSVANACGNCPPKARILPLGRELLVGFGGVAVSRDGVNVWAGGMHEKRRASGQKRVAHAELWARTASESDWRITFTGPMSEEIYQRQPEGWVLVWRGFGFA